MNWPFSLLEGCESNSPMEDYQLGERIAQESDFLPVLEAMGENEWSPHLGVCHIENDGNGEFLQKDFKFLRQELPENEASSQLHSNCGDSLEEEKSNQKYLTKLPNTTHVTSDTLVSISEGQNKKYRSYREKSHFSKYKRELEGESKDSTLSKFIKRLKSKPASKMMRWTAVLDKEGLECDRRKRLNQFSTDDLWSIWKQDQVNNKFHSHDEFNREFAPLEASTSEISQSRGGIAQLNTHMLNKFSVEFSSGSESGSNVIIPPPNNSSKCSLPSSTNDGSSDSHNLLNKYILNGSLSYTGDGIKLSHNVGASSDYLAFDLTSPESSSMSISMMSNFLSRKLPS